MNNKNPEMVEIDESLQQVIAGLTMVHEVINKKVLSNHGLRRPRFFTLEALHFQPGLTLGQLCEKVLLDRASASRMVFSMEKEDLVRRELDEDDRRQFTLYLTQAGQTLYATASADFKADIQARFATLDPQTKQTLLELNSKLQQTLADHFTRLTSG